MCLDVADNGTKAKTPVEAGQNGTTAIVGVQSGFCLDSSGGPTEGGRTQLVINSCSGATSQNWNVRRSHVQAEHQCPISGGEQRRDGNRHTRADFILLSRFRSTANTGKGENINT